MGYPFFFRYRDGISENDQLVQWLWQTLESYTNEEKILFLRFVSGRSRLPTRVSEIPQRFQVMKWGQVGTSVCCSSIVIYIRTSVNEYYTLLRYNDILKWAAFVKVPAAIEHGECFFLDFEGCEHSSLPPWYPLSTTSHHQYASL